MPQIIFLPHEELCPDGMVIEAEPGTTICDAALKNHIEIEPVSYTHLTLPTIRRGCRSRWSPYH